MAGNTTPIFSRIGVISGSTIGSVQTFSSGSYTVGSNIFPVFIADATNGAYVQRVRFAPISTTAATATTATVLRVYVSSVSTSGSAATAANTWLFQEVAAAAQTPATTTAVAYIEVPLNFALPPGYAILANASTTATANTGWVATVFGGAY